MRTDLRVVVPNRHGAALALFDAIAGAGVNVDGMCGDLRRGERWGYIHVLTDDGPRAQSAVEAAGFEVAAQQQVDVIEIGDRPSAIAEALRPFQEDGRNISVLYIATGTRVVIGAEDMLEQRPGVKLSDA